MENRIKVELADANENFRTMLQQTIENTGEFDVVGSAGDGAEAWKMIERERPQLVITDVILPELDGFALPQEYRDDGPVKTDIYGNEIRPQQVAAGRITENYLFDYAGAYSEPLSLCLTQGTHRLTLEDISGMGDIADIAPLPPAHYTGPNLYIKATPDAQPADAREGIVANPVEVM